MGNLGSSDPPARAQFNYGRFSDEARQIVMTGADLALSAGAARALPEHLAAAVYGAQRSNRDTRDLGFVAFAEETMAVLHDVFYAADEAERTVEVHHLRSALE